MRGCVSVCECAGVRAHKHTHAGRPKREDLRFFTPAGFTFAIWAPIFLGELLMALSAFAPGFFLFCFPFLFFAV